ncbi:hypothetical protein KR018_003378 [Drosophila ironensis]|nr:hypothetical protein KR018_003378 [Drosophila ironensis]
MDFLTNLIKRPISMASGAATASPTEAANATSSREDDEPPKNETGIPTTATNLGELFMSGSDDLEEWSKNLLLDLSPTDPSTSASNSSASSRTSIQQLLSEVNGNLTQVSAYEMEHLQAMSGELSPIAVKASPLAITDHQKALASLSQQSKAEVTSGIHLDVEGLPKFKGLPEFDEAQIPELASLNVDMNAQLNKDHTDSDIFVECPSLPHGRYSEDRSELEAYSSALNDVLEQQMSTASAANYESTCDDPLAVSQHNLSYEPMDVDDVNETMESLRDVLDPDHQQLLQQFLCEGQALAVNTPVQLEATSVAEQPLELQEEKKEPIIFTMADIIGEPFEEAQHQEKVEELSPEIQHPYPVKQLALPELEKHIVQDPQQITDMPEESQELCQPLETQLQQEEIVEPHELQSQPPIKPKTAEEELQISNEIHMEIPKEFESSPQIQPSSELPIKSAVSLSLSPPIPTHREKTAEELEFLALKEFPMQQGREEQDQPTVAIEGKENTQESTPTHCVPVVVVTPTRKRSTTPPTVEIGCGNSSVPQDQNCGPSSPCFPIKGPAEPPFHFPHTPHAPPESDELPYLEEAVVEPSADHIQGVCGPGVIARSPICIEVSHPSPEQHQHLSETLPIGEVSPTHLNGTFNSAGRVEFSPNQAAPLQGSSTFAITLDATDERQRRTFSVVQSNEEQAEVKDRRTFCLEPDMDNSRRTFCLEPNTSPAVEATEDNVVGNELEAMDVDLSIRMEECQAQPANSTSPPIPTHQNLKRAPIHSELTPCAPSLGNATVVLEEQALSAKEKATLSASDEKDDVFVEHFGAISPVSDDMFKTPQFTSGGFQNQARMKNNALASATGALDAGMGRNRESIAGADDQFFDAEFQDSAANQNLILNSSDFDYLYTKGSNNAPIDRSSLLLKFDPLLGAPVPVNHPQQQEQALLNILGSNQNQIPNRALSPTLEELETSVGNQSLGIAGRTKDTAKKLDPKPPVDRTKKHAKMSVDVIDNDSNKSFDNSNFNSEDKAHTYNNMDDIEKKIKNEVTRSEDIEKKLKEAEQREEALIKRITEKDKTNAKLNGVIEAYEKAIAELISEKEQLSQGYERQLQEVQADRDDNYHHLMSLETTFSDLHVKYEKSKQMTSQLKANEETLLGEAKQLMDNLRLQEQRYDKMKSHAMQQLEIANKKLDTNTREHADEVKKLKALLKKEEISRVSTTEQLQQKSRENADLLKICEELIYGKGQGGSS